MLQYPAMNEILSGIIERVTFHNPENGFAVLRVEAKGRRGPVTVVGRLASAVAGEYLEATGTWEQEPEHGLQFKADELRTAPPQSVEGIEKYLGSGLVKGIGPHYARKIVAVFGERTLKVIDDSPTFLREVKGIGPQRISRIRESWREQKAVRAIMMFLQSHGIGTNRAVRIYKTYGDKAIDVVRSNPYRLADDIWGVGFQTADQLAERLGIERTSPFRAQAALRFTLQELSQDGHCGFPEEEVREQTAKLLQVESPIIAAAVKELINQKEILSEAAIPSGEPWLYLRSLHSAEVSVARALNDLKRGPHPLPDIKLEAALDWIEKKMGMMLAPAQRNAIQQATTQKVLVITGGPGVGKTTLVRGIVEIFTAKELRVGLCAPTGRAAKRLAETTGREAKTIHRLLEFDRGGCKRNREHPLSLDMLLIDETSMVDIQLMSRLLAAVPERACLILVGDVDQLPSVGPGTVLADTIESKAVPVVRLTEVFRQAESSGIVRAAHRINQGRLPEPGSAESLTDFYFIECDQPGAILDRIVTLVRERIPARFNLDPFRDVQVLTPMNRGDLGTRNLNVKLQEILNPAMDGPEIQRFGWTFRIGDKVLQTVNDYDKDVFNGDVGRIKSIDMEEQELTVDYDGRRVVYDFGELDELSLAYALTAHKSQGSEYPAVVLALHTQHFMMLQRNLLYTAITRGKKLVVIVGSRRALELAVQRQDTNRRCTALSRRLGDYRRGLQGGTLE